MVADDYKVKIYIQIVRYYLEDEDSVSADAYLNRAAMLNPQDPVRYCLCLFKVEKRQSMLIHFNVLYYIESSSAFTSKSSPIPGFQKTIRSSGP